MHELRRSGKSPTDMSNQVNELMHLKYERAHLAYLQAIQSVRDADTGIRQNTIGQFVRTENMLHAFGEYEDQSGWCGVSISGFYDGLSAGRVSSARAGYNMTRPGHFWAGLQL